MIYVYTAELSATPKFTNPGFGQVPQTVSKEREGDTSSLAYSKAVTIFMPQKKI